MTCTCIMKPKLHYTPPDSISERTELFHKSEWKMIAAGELPWYDEVPNRSSLGRGVRSRRGIISSFQQADESLSYTDVDFFYDSWRWYSEFKLTWQARNASLSRTSVLGVEIPGLLQDVPPEAVHSLPNSMRGTWRKNLLQYSYDVEIHGGSVTEASCNRGCLPSWNLAAHKIFDGMTNRFKMSLDGDSTPAITFRPNVIRYSIVAGMRVYTASNDASADPRRYALHGRGKPGVKIKHMATETCWYIASDMTVATGSCSDDGDEYLFYTNRFGEIRSPSSIGNCVELSPLGGLQFTTCHSYQFGENHTKTRSNSFTFNGAALGGLFSIEPIEPEGKCVGPVALDIQGYIRHDTGGCLNRDELGSTTGGSAQDCADSCTVDPSCVSFEYEKVGTECRRSTSCDSFSLTENDPNDPYRWYLKDATIQMLLGTHPCSNNTESVHQFYIGSEGTFNVSADQGWQEISSGILPWISSESRNPVGLAISSTHNNGDNSLNFVEVKFYDNAEPYYEYKLSFPELRSRSASQLQFAEIELPGLRLHSTADDVVKARTLEIVTDFKHSDECILGSRLELLRDTTRQDCAQRCVDHGLAKCQGFVFIPVAVEGSQYEPNDCQLLESSFRDGCNNRHHQRELFIISLDPPAHRDQYVSQLPSKSHCCFRGARPNKLCKVPCYHNLV